MNSPYRAEISGTNSANDKSHNISKSTHQTSNWLDGASIFCCGQAWDIWDGYIEAMRAMAWPEKTDHLLGICEEHFHFLEAEPASVAEFSVLKILNGLTEQFAEIGRPSVDAAALYLLSFHPGSRKLAISRLKRVRHTRFRNLVNNDPRYRRLLRAAIRLFPMPAWVEEVAR